MGPFTSRRSSRFQPPGLGRRHKNPGGTVGSYGQYARLMPAPEGMEIPAYLALGWVGSAMAALPDEGMWQRVSTRRQWPGAR